MFGVIQIFNLFWCQTLMECFADISASLSGGAALSGSLFRYSVRLALILRGKNGFNKQNINIKYSDNKYYYTIELRIWIFLCANYLSEGQEQLVIDVKSWPFLKTISRPARGWGWRAVFKHFKHPELTRNYFGDNLIVLASGDQGWLCVTVLRLSGSFNLVKTTQTGPS